MLVLSRLRGGTLNVQAAMREPMLARQGAVGPGAHLELPVVTAAWRWLGRLTPSARVDWPRRASARTWPVPVSMTGACPVAVPVHCVLAAPGGARRQ
jgi:hypothetical protein